RIDIDGDELRRRASLDDSRIARIKRVSLPIGALQRAVGAGDVGEEQRIGVDQDRIALGMRLAHDWCRGEEAVGKSLGHGARLRCIRLREVVRVARKQLNLVLAQAVKIDDVALAHQAAEEEFFSETAREIDRKEEWR